MIDNLRAGRRETAGRDETEQTKTRMRVGGSSRRRDSAAPTSSSNQNRGEKKREREQSRTRTKKKGNHFIRDVVKRLGVSIRGGVPVDMVSVPRLPLRLHSLAASRTGSKRLAREEEEDTDADMDA